jgi:cell wall-associated NlpC family hydrolase
VSVPIKAAAAAASLTLALIAAPATAFTDTQFQAQAHTRTTAQQADRVLRGLPGPQGPQAGRALLALVQKEVRRRRAELIAGWKARASRAVRFAYSQRGRPYVWGGTGRGGFDCSGLVQQSWRHAGVRLARTASSQFHTIHTHISSHRLRPGDLVFFHGLGHVGMYVGHGRFIHSPHTGDHVRVTRFDRYYRRTFVGATRPAWHPLPHIPTILHPEVGLDRWGVSWVSKRDQKRAHGRTG